MKRLDLASSLPRLEKPGSAAISIITKSTRIGQGPYGWYFLGPFSYPFFPSPADSVSASPNILRNAVFAGRSMSSLSSEGGSSGTPPSSHVDSVRSRQHHLHQSSCKNSGAKSAMVSVKWRTPCQSSRTAVMMECPAVSPPVKRRTS